MGDCNHFGSGVGMTKDEFLTQTAEDLRRIIVRMQNTPGNVHSEMNEYFLDIFAAHSHLMLVRNEEALNENKL